MILDLDLPQIGGIEILQFIKQHNKLKSIPVVIMSHNDIQSTIAECYENYSNGYIVKPVSFEKLLKIVANLTNYWFDSNVQSIPGFNL